MNNKNKLLLISSFIFTFFTFFAYRFLSDTVSVSILLLLFLAYVLVIGFIDVRFLSFYILLFSDYCAGFLPINLEIFGISLMTTDISIVLLVYLSLLFLIKYKGIINIKLFIVPIVILSFVIISSRVAQIHSGQSFITGVLTQRQLIVYSLIPFLFLKFKENNSFQKDIMVGFRNVVEFEILIYLLQFVILLFNSNALFLNMTLSKRYFWFRLHIFNVSLMMYFLFLCIKYVKDGLNRSDYILMLLISFLIVLVGQYRMASLGLFSSLVFSYIIKNRNNKAILVCAVLIFLIVFILINYIPSVGNYFDADTSSMVRSNALDFYEQKISISPIFGYGSINNSNGIADDILGTKYGFYLIDLGAFMLKFSYGLIGYGFYYILLIFSIVLSFVKFKKCKVQYIILPFFFLIVSRTLLTPYYYSSTIIILLLSLYSFGGENNEYRLSYSKL